MDPSDILAPDPILPVVVEIEPVDLRRAGLQFLRDPWFAETVDGVVPSDLVGLAEAGLDEGDDMLARRLLWTAAQQVTGGSAKSRADDRAQRAERMGPPGDDPWLLAISAAIGSADPASISEAAARSSGPTRRRPTSCWRGWRPRSRATSSDPGRSSRVPRRCFEAMATAGPWRRCS